MAPIITLLTDFGTADTYVAQMKGVILGICPDARIVDLTHEVPAQDVQAGAWQLRMAQAWFPAGTVHVAVVDPGVGTSRRAIAARADGRLYVGPDNGVLSWAIDLRAAEVVEISDARWMAERVSRTFHGRDVFVPVAAHLGSGVPLDDLGRRIEDAVVLPYPSPRVEDGELVGEVIHVDRFGNSITSIDEAAFAGWTGAGSPPVEAEAAGRAIRMVATYGDAAPGVPVALFGSAGHLEIAVRDGNAARVLRLERGAPVRVRRR